MECVKKTNIQFDDTFAMTGGEDIFFFSQIERAGGKIVWADHAIVHELHTPSRACVRWLLLRAFRCGNVDAIINVKSKKGYTLLAFNIVKNICKIIYGLGAALVAFSKPHSVRCLQTAVSGLGGLFGYLGGIYHEYK
jgi:hypothetical protein